MDTNKQGVKGEVKKIVIGVVMFVAFIGAFVLSFSLYKLYFGQDYVFSGGEIEQINRKEANEFYPLEIGDFQIEEVGIDSYKVVPVSVSEYEREGAEANEASANVKESFVADYQNEESSNILHIQYMKFANAQEAEDAHEVNDILFKQPTEGFANVEFRARGAESWFAFRNVDDNDKMSSDFRVIFKEALVQIRITVDGELSVEEAKRIIVDYFDNLLSDEASYVSEEEIMTLSVYIKEILNQTQEGYEKQKDEMLEDFKDKTDSMKEEYFESMPEEVQDQFDEFD